MMGEERGERRRNCLSNASLSLYALSVLVLELVLTTVLVLDYSKVMLYHISFTIFFINFFLT